MTAVCRIAAAFLVSFLLLPAPNAEAADWQFRLHGQWVSSSGEFFAGQDFDDAFGVYAGVERRLGERWGVELGIGWNELEAGESFSLDFFGFSVLTEVDAVVETTALTVALNYHLSPPSSRADVYLAPVIGWAFLDADLETRVDVDFPFGLPGIVITSGDVGNVDLGADDSFLYGLRLGADWPLGDAGWAVSGAIDYSVLELEADGADIADLDPLRVGLGFAFAF